MSLTLTLITALTLIGCGNKFEPVVITTPLNEELQSIEFLTKGTTDKSVITTNTGRKIIVRGLVATSKPGDQLFEKSWEDSNGYMCYYLAIGSAEDAPAYRTTRLK